MLSNHYVNAYSGNSSNIHVLKDWKFHFAGADSSIGYAISADTAGFQNVKIPHTFLNGSQQAVPPQGWGWYVKNIDIPDNASGSDVILRFEGVCLRAEVFIDGKFVARNNFAYIPFQVDISEFIHGKKQIHVAVRIDNRLLSRQIPDKNARGWWLYGGMIREAAIEFKSECRIDRVETGTYYRGNDSFGLHVKLYPAHGNWDSVQICIRHKKQSVPAYSATIMGNDTLLEISRVSPWSPENPVLYIFEFVPFFKGNARDTLNLSRGFCQLYAQKSGLYLNGRPYYIRGISRHDVLDDKGPIISRSERLRDLLDIKSLGVNFLRIAHFPQHQDIYELCDSIGLLVMDEIPAWKTASDFLSSPSGKQFGVDYAGAMVSAHCNHTCVCLWSIGNQFGSYKKSVAGFVSVVSSEVKKRDASRPVTFCSFYYIWDKAFSYIDIISINEYFGWELASLDVLGKMLDEIHKDWPDKPVMISELGAQAKYGFRNSKPVLAGMIRSVLTKDISEDHQALYIRSHIDTIWTRRSYVDGMVVWSYSDYMTYMNKSRTSDMPKGLNSCGIVSSDRRKKLSYPVVQERYNFLKEQWMLEHDPEEGFRKQ